MTIRKWPSKILNSIWPVLISYVQDYVSKSEYHHQLQFSAQQIRIFKKFEMIF